MPAPIRLGTQGWNYDAWRGAFYPEGMGPARWLGEYARHFDTVEVNSTFYRLASRKAVEGWVADTPDDFCFAVKASRYLTHVKRLADDAGKSFTLREGIARFHERIEPLVDAGKLGPVLWQLPASFRRDDERLAHLLALAPPGRHCLEFRHASWEDEAVSAALAERGAALVVSDTDERPDPPLVATAGFGYLRLRRVAYGETELAAWAERVRASGWSEAFVYFKHEDAGTGPRLARHFAALFAGA